MKSFNLAVILMLAFLSFRGESYANEIMSCKQLLQAAETKIRISAIPYQDEVIREFRDYKFLNNNRTSFKDLKQTDGKILFYVNFKSEKWVATSFINEETRRVSIRFYRFNVNPEYDHIEKFIYDRANEDLISLLRDMKELRVVPSAGSGVYALSILFPDLDIDKAISDIDFDIVTEQTDQNYTMHEFSMNNVDIGGAFSPSELLYSVLNLIFLQSEGHVEVNPVRNQGLLDYTTGTFNGLTDAEAVEDSRYQTGSGALLIEEAPARSLEELIRGE